MQEVIKILKHPIIKKLWKKNLIKKRMKRQRFIEGGILEIPINNGEYYVYAQILKYKQVAFLDYKSNAKLTDFEILKTSNVLFILSVIDNVINEGIWLIVGRLPIRDSLLTPPNQYGYIWEFNRFFIRDITINKTIFCKKEDVIGLELWRGVYWNAQMVEDRINDYYNNVKCKWLIRHYRIWETVNKYESLGYHESSNFNIQINNKTLSKGHHRQRFAEGGIIEIPINQGEYYVYAQIIKKEQLAFFDFQSKTPLTSYDILNECNILFVIAVYRDIITTGVWLIVSKLPIRDSLLIPPNKYIYDWESNMFQLYNTMSGEIINCSRNDVIGLEICEVWDSNDVESRIINYYNKSNNIWTDSNYRIMALTEK